MDWKVLPYAARSSDSTSTDCRLFGSTLRSLVAFETSQKHENVAVSSEIRNARESRRKCGEIFRILIRYAYVVYEWKKIEKEIQTEFSVVEILFYLKKKELALLSLIANGASFDYCKFFAKCDQRRANVEHTRAIRRRLKLFNYDRHIMTKKKKGENEWKVRNVAKDVAEGRRQRSRRPTLESNHKDPLLFKETTSSNSYFLAKFLFPPLRLWSVERALSLFNA